MRSAVCRWPAHKKILNLSGMSVYFFLFDAKLRGLKNFMERINAKVKEKKARHEEKIQR